MEGYAVSFPGALGRSRGQIIHVFSFQTGSHIAQAGLIFTTVAQASLKLTVLLLRSTSAGTKVVLRSAMLMGVVLPLGHISKVY